MTTIITQQDYYFERVSLLLSSFVVPPDVAMQLLSSGGTALQLLWSYYTWTLCKMCNQGATFSGTLKMPSHSIPVVGGTPSEPHE